MMPVHKFRTIEEMNEFDRQRRRTNDPRLFERIESHWRGVGGLCPPLAIPAGVHKFRTIEEMHEFKERFVDKRIALIREQKTR
jgi:hypothetical protein